MLQLGAVRGGVRLGRGLLAALFPQQFNVLLTACVTEPEGQTDNQTFASTNRTTATAAKQKQTYTFGPLGPTRHSCTHESIQIKQK